MFYLTTYRTHFIYSYMASDIWLRTTQIAREETCCRYIGYSFRSAEFKCFHSISFFIKYYVESLWLWRPLVIHYSKYSNSMSKLDTFLYMPYLVRTEIPPDLERDVAQR